MIRGVPRDWDAYDEERGAEVDGGSPGQSPASFIFGSPLRISEKSSGVSRVRLMSGEAVGDLIDFFVELLWYRRPDRLAALEKEHEVLSVAILVLAWYSSAVFAITTSKKLMLVLPLPFTLCTAQFTTATIVSVIISHYGLCGRGISGGSTQGRKVGSKGGGSGEESISLVEDNLTLMSMMSINSRGNKSGSSTSGPGRIVSNNGGGMTLNRERDGSGSSNSSTDSGRSVGNAEMGLSRVGKGGKSTKKDENNILIESLPGLSGIFGVFTLPPSHMYTRLLYLTAVSYTCGFLFTNFAFSVVTASFAETVKSGEPISSVVFGYFVLHEKSSSATYLTLVPIIVGVALSCFHDDSFNFFGFSCAALSNIMFSLRAVLTKRMIRTFPSVTDEVTLFGHISMIGLCMLIPLSLYMEGARLVEGFFLDLDTTYTSSRHELLFILLCNTLAYTTYNTMSFLVLRRTTMVTHAVLNCFRRVFIIVFTCHYFQVPISNFNLAGIGVAVTGVILFGWTKTISLRRD